jgi:hypothetical protein
MSASTSDNQNEHESFITWGKKSVLHFEWKKTADKHIMYSLFYQLSEIMH